MDPFEEILRQLRNILLPLAGVPESAGSPRSGGNKDRAENFPCSTIAAKSVLVDAKIRAASGTVCIPPRGCTTFSCKRTQQLRLQLQRELADLIQEDRPAILPTLRPASLLSQFPPSPETEPGSAPFTNPNSSPSSTSSRPRSAIHRQ